MPNISLIQTFRDLFIRSVSKLAERKLQKYIEENCDGCFDRTWQKTQVRLHNICIMMSWADQLIVFLPDVLKKLTMVEVTSAFETTYYRIRPEFSTKEMKDVPMPFNVTTFLCIYMDEMCSDLIFQTSIAQAIYSQFVTFKTENVEQFGNRYRITCTAHRDAEDDDDDGNSF